MFKLVILLLVSVLVLSCQSPVQDVSATLPTGWLPAGVVDIPAEDYQGWALTVHVDPEAPGPGTGTAADPWPNLDFLATYNVPPNTLIAIKRGTVLRLSKTIDLKGGTKGGWVSYGAYGSTADPKPVILGSQGDLHWSDSASSRIQADWSGNIDTNAGRNAGGPEQGPGNLWFFSGSSPEATMTGWGWRKQSLAAVITQGDWYYDAATRKIELAWPKGDSPPGHTEAGVNRIMFNFSGQSYLMVQDLDLRYGGNYLVRGHSAEHLVFRRLDMSFFGGGTKNGEFIRLGNGIELNGNVNDVHILSCRIHQAYDTGFDQQHAASEGSPGVIQQNLVFRNNLVSHAGLASFELWARPGGSRIHNLQLSNNTFLHAGGGWGFEQHDFPGTQELGADIVIFQNTATGSEIRIEKNVFFKPRLGLVCEWQDHQYLTKALLRETSLDQNLWVGSFQESNPLALLYQGNSLAESSVFTTLSSWQLNSLAPGKDPNSILDPDGSIAAFVEPVDPAWQNAAWIWSTGTPAAVRPRLADGFGLGGNYRRIQSGPSAGWGAEFEW